MAQVADNIWVGTYADSLNARFTSERNITHILCCAAEYDTVPGFLVLSKQSERWHRLELDQRPELDNRATLDTRPPLDKKKMDKLVTEGASKLNEWLNEGRSVILHCSTTFQRTILVLIEYFVKYKGWTAEIANSHLRQKLNCKVTNK